MTTSTSSTGHRRRSSSDRAKDGSSRITASSEELVNSVVASDDKLREEAGKALSSQVDAERQGRAGGGGGVEEKAGSAAAAAQEEGGAEEKAGSAAAAGGGGVAGEKVAGSEVSEKSVVTFAEQAEKKKKIPDGVRMAGLLGRPSVKGSRRSTVNVEWRTEVADVALLGDMDGGLGAYLHMNGLDGPKRAVLSMADESDAEASEFGNVLRVERGGCLVDLPCESIENLITDPKEIQEYIDSGRVPHLELDSESALANCFIVGLTDMPFCVELGSPENKDLLVKHIKDAKTQELEASSATALEGPEQRRHLSRMLETYDGTYSKFKFSNRWNDVGVFLSEYPDKKDCKLFLDTDVGRLLFRRHTSDVRSLPVRLISNVYSTQEELDDMERSAAMKQSSDATIQTGIEAEGFRKPFIVEFRSHALKEDFEAALEVFFHRMDEQAQGKANRLAAVRNSRRISTAVVAAFH
eukprot:GHVS01010789.1.p1 GENE.GHVS01010789.1~~GHVS01010789.1.p1  ORF type:complete len:511 (+),score=120.33 GHVS01010789.1:134-1534(+)